MRSSLAKPFVLFLAICPVLVIRLSLAEGGLPIQLPMELEGTLQGAPYRIRVPDNWNGTLLVFAHGYNRQLVPFLPITPSYVDPTQEEYFLERGYALAASAFVEDGWAVMEGIQNTRTLTTFFKHRVGRPNYLILWGRSMGSIIAFASIEKYPQIYDGIISLCSVGAGTSRTFDGALDFGLAYDIAFGWPESWGSVGDVRDNIAFDEEVLPVLRAQLADPSNLGRFEFIRRVSRLPSEGFYSPPVTGPPSTGEPPFLFQTMFFVTEGRGELESRAGGPVSQNLNHAYTLSDEDKADLASFGVDAAALLTEMNARTNVEAPRDARRYLKRYADYSGKIKRPVLTLHGIGDGLVPVSHETAYRETVEAAGNEDMLAQTFVDRIGHCDYTAQQLEEVVSAMEHWLDTGQVPTVPDFFPADLGFLPSFDPGRFPQPALP